MSLFAVKSQQDIGIVWLKGPPANPIGKLRYLALMRSRYTWAFLKIVTIETQIRTAVVHMTATGLPLGKSGTLGKILGQCLRYRTGTCACDQDTPAIVEVVRVSHLSTE